MCEEQKQVFCHVNGPLRVHLENTEIPGVHHSGIYAEGGYCPEHSSSQNDHSRHHILGHTDHHATSDWSRFPYPNWRIEGDLMASHEHSRISFAIFLIVHQIDFGIDWFFRGTLQILARHYIVELCFYGLLSA